MYGQTELELERMKMTNISLSSACQLVIVAFLAQRSQTGNCARDAIQAPETRITQKPRPANTLHECDADEASPTYANTQIDTAHAYMIRSFPDSIIQVQVIQ